MYWNNKVIWSEGMFLRTQHFQQQDRYVERLVRNRTAHLRPHPWGVAKLAIDRSLLTTGRFAIAEGVGTLTIIAAIWTFVVAELIDVVSFSWPTTFHVKLSALENNSWPFSALVWAFRVYLKVVVVTGALDLVRMAFRRHRTSSLSSPPLVLINRP